MENINESFTKYTRSNLDAMLKKDYATAVKNPEFKKLVNTLKIKENVAYKYTSKLERTVCELNNCSNCKSLHTCQNKVEGTVYYPTIKDEKLEFNYVACKYKKKDIKQKEEIKSKFFEMPYHIKMAKMSNIEINSTRAKIIKWINKFYDDFKSDKQTKGLYLSGSFGSGKTYILSALLNELSKLNYSCIIVYYPELLRSIKESFNSDDYKIIGIDESLSLLEPLRVVGVDTETSGLSCHKDKLLSLQLGCFDFQVVVDCLTIDVT